MVYVEQSPGTTVKNTPITGEVKVGQYVDNLDQKLSATEANIRGTDGDDLKTLSDQLDGVDTDLGTMQGNVTDILADTNETQGKLPTNEIMGSSDKADHDGEIGDILADTADMQPKLGTPAVTLADDIAAVQTSVDDISNNTRFSATIPDLERPLTGSVAYKIRVNLEDTSGNPEDPDADTITVNVVNNAGASRNSNLSSTTMTKLAVGRYEVTYNLASTHLLEQLIFEFSYAENTVAFTKDKTKTVVDATEVGYTSTDRSRDNQIAVDTAAIVLDTDEMQLKLPTNEIMGSSVKSDKDDEIDAIKLQTDQLNFSGANVQARVADKGILNDLSAVQVNAEVDQALLDYDGPTKAELDTAESNIRGIDGDDLKTLSDQLDGVDTKLGTPVTSIAADIAATLARLNDLHVAAETTVDAVSTPILIKTGLAGADDLYNNMVVVIVNAGGAVARNVDDYASGDFTVVPLPFTPAVSDPVLVLKRTGSVPVDLSSITTTLANILADTDETQTKLPTNEIMGSSDKADHDIQIGDILTDTADIQPKIGTPSVTLAADIAAVGTKVDGVETKVNAVQVDVTSIKATIEARTTVKQSFSYNPTTNTLVANVWAERSNLVQTGPSALTFTLYDEDGAQVFQETAASPDAQGFFKVSKVTPGIVKNKAYYAVSQLTLGSAISSGKAAFTIG